MAVKVIMTWDIAPERDQEYFEFVIGEFVPGVQRLGLQPAEAWATLYGSYPQIQVGLLAPDASEARRVLGAELALEPVEQALGARSVRQVPRGRQAVGVGRIGA